MSTCNCLLAISIWVLHRSPEFTKYRIKSLFLYSPKLLLLPRSLVMNNATFLVTYWRNLLIVLHFFFNHSRQYNLFILFFLMIYNLILISGIQCSGSAGTHIIKSSPKLGQLLSVNIERYVTEPLARFSVLPSPPYDQLY